MLTVITSFFNPENYKTKYDNFYKFTEPLNQRRIPWVCVEALFGSETKPLVTPSGIGKIVRVLGKHVMWQKERMLNVAMKHLPRACDAVLWSDCDILFENDGWYEETLARLQSCPVVQPFERVIRLPRGHDHYRGYDEQWAGPGFASVYQRNPNMFMNGHFDQHGHTGFAWAARRDIIANHGLYDACIAGSGDHMMAHAFVGDWHSPCVRRILGGNNKHADHFGRWAENIYGDIRARITSVSGRIFHLWHGDIGNRKYVIRNRELAQMNFDPARDVSIGKSGLYEWTRRGRRMEQWAIDYFKSREEDQNCD